MALELFSTFVLPHVNKNNVEIEFRLGKKNGNIFDTNVGRTTFEKIHRRLSNYPEWESVKQQRALVYHGARKGLRIVYDEDTDEQTVVSKYNVANRDIVLQNEPFDARVSVSIENPATYDNEKDRFPIVKKRVRTSFLRKGLSIDMSVVENEDKDSEETHVYRVEFEIVTPTKDLTGIQFANHYQKVFDVLKLVV
jgi:hypothetical protein